MTGGFVALLLAGAVAGGMISGLAGFGTALFALGFWLQILPPTQAVAIVVIMSVISGLQGMWVVRRDIRNQPRRLARFLLPALIGVPLGVQLLSVISADALKLVIGGFLVLYGGFFTLRRNLPKFTRPTPVVDAAIGFAGGILGGAASLSGALPVMWCAMRPWPKGETRAVLQPYNFAVLGLAVVFFIREGLYTRQTLLLTAMALPATILGVQIGIALFKRLTDQQFRRLLIFLMFVSGSIIILNQLF